ncbi:hypothetical protein K1719_043920 [Acacia pycnantha]|nr:hypothetical protein K1719_043920 [Acacia pycnantha]
MEIWCMQQREEAKLHGYGPVVLTMEWILEKSNGESWKGGSHYCCFCHGNHVAQEHSISKSNKSIANSDKTSLKKLTKGNTSKGIMWYKSIA